MPNPHTFTSAPIFEMRNSKLYFLPVIPSKSELANFREAGVIVLTTR